MNSCPSSLSRDLVVGVDPGVSGALAFYDLRLKRLDHVMDMPTRIEKTLKGKTRTRVDPVALALTLDTFQSRLIGAVVEYVAASPRDGVVGAFSFGFSTGLIHGVFSSMMIDVQMARPSVWKPLYGLGIDKDESRLLASTLFPTENYFFSRKKDHGRAEAALLAKFGERIFKCGGTK